MLFLNKKKTSRIVFINEVKPLVKPKVKPRFFAKINKPGTQNKTIIRFENQDEVV